MNAEKKTIFGLLAAAAVLLAALAVSCGKDSLTAKDQEEIDLAGTEWELISIESLKDNVFDDFEGEVWEVPGDEWYIIQFTSEGEINGVSFCNSCSGSYVISFPDSISINWACTRAVCGRSTEFNGFVVNARSFEISVDTLQVEYLQEAPWPKKNGILHLVKRNTSN